MNLAQLTKILEIPSEITTDISSHNLIQPITSIHYRSQDVRPGGLFVAVKGFAVDGHDYIPDAVKNGAAAILAQRPVETHLPVLVVPDTRKALPIVAAEFYCRPAQRLTTVGITGTSGKTTITYLLEQILSAAGHNCGIIGTNNYRYCGKVFPNPVTTPESLDLQRILADMSNAGVSHAVMEVSSHALDLHRVDQCDFNLGVFTNLSQDHLDYHHDMESYFKCKQRLFYEHLKPLSLQSPQAQAVINVDNEHGLGLYRQLSCSKLSTGTAENAIIRAVKWKMNLLQTTLDIDTPLGVLKIDSSLIGRHNLENLLCAIGAAVAINIDLNAIKKGVESLSCVPGRLEMVPNHRKRHVYVDYAHKPDALLHVLNTLRPLLTGRLICVMGCGGDRDQTKRPIMGKIAGSLSDLTIITSDNPRSESPHKIISQIVTGVKQSKKDEFTTKQILNGFSQTGYVIEPDRKKAIELAVAVSNSGDTILIAGKGHENYQIIGTKTIDFDDVLVARKALES